jgi:hypothetical protein
VLPKFSDTTNGDDAPLRVLREKCDAAKVLGLVKCEVAEILVVYDGQHLFLPAISLPDIYHRIWLLHRQAW